MFRKPAFRVYPSEYSHTKLFRVLQTLPVYIKTGTAGLCHYFCIFKTQFTIIYMLVTVMFAIYFLQYYNFKTPNGNLDDFKGACMFDV